MRDHVYRIFVASPANVKKERNSLSTIINEVNIIAGEHLHLQFELIRWETHATPSMGRPQEIINIQLKIAECDLFIGILWHRFGSRTGGENIRGELYESGTEEEFDIAYTNWLDKHTPSISFLRCKRKASPKDIDPEQLSKVEKFFDRFSFSGETPGLISEYNSPSEFEQCVRRILLGFALNRSMDIDLSKKNPGLLPSAFLEHGFDRLYTPSTNSFRNQEKSVCIQQSNSLKLIAHSGFSFIAEFGHKFRHEIESHLAKGGSFRAVLTNPWTESAFFIALGELYNIGSDDIAKHYEDPVLTIEKSNWYRIKYRDSITGYLSLRQSYDSLIDIRFSSIEIPSSILITDNCCFFEPYLPVNLWERSKNNMLTFELKISEQSPLYKYSSNYFNYLWESSETFESLNYYEEGYKALLQNIIMNIKQGRKN